MLAQNRYDAKLTIEYIGTMSNIRAISVYIRREHNHKRGEALVLTPLLRFLVCIVYYSVMIDHK